MSYQRPYTEQEKQGICERDRLLADQIRKHLILPNYIIKAYLIKR